MLPLDFHVNIYVESYLIFDIKISDLITSCIQLNIQF